VADKDVAPTWFAILKAEHNHIQPYLDEFELMKDPRLEPLEANGEKYTKLTYSVFDRYVDYERVLHEAVELIALLTGALRIRQGPGALAIVNVVKVFPDGREEKFPPYAQPLRISLDLVGFIGVRKPGIPPRPTIEQYIMEHVIRSDDQLVRDVLHYLSNPPDFFNLYKILEVISLDLGNGSKPKGFNHIEKRGWATKTELDTFKNTADNVHRHWKKNRPAPQMHLQEAVLMSRKIIMGWVVERAAAWTNTKSGRA